MAGVVLTDEARFEVKMPGVKNEGLGLNAFANPGKGHEILKRSDKRILAAFGFTLFGGCGLSDGFFFRGLRDLHPTCNKSTAFGI